MAHKRNGNYILFLFQTIVLGHDTNRNVSYMYNECIPALFIDEYWSVKLRLTLPTSINSLLKVYRIS